MLNTQAKNMKNLSNQTKNRQSLERLGTEFVMIEQTKIR